MKEKTNTEPERLSLVEPEEIHAESITAYRKAFLASGESMDGTANLRTKETAEEWLEWVKRMKDPATCPEKLVPATQFVYVRASDGKVVGMLQLRHWLNAYLLSYGGHIGYSVSPDERGKGYAKGMLREALTVCGRMGIREVLVTCLQENEASRRTILSNGGVYENTVFEPELKETIERYWIRLPSDPTDSN